MKKFLALLTALSLLAFAGSAFATEISASTEAVTLIFSTGQKTATATVTGTASHGGDLSYAVTGDGAAFTTLSSTTGATGESITLTFAPADTVTSKTYTVTVTVTESYSESEAGHARPATDTATTDIAVTVNNYPPLSFTVTPSATTIMAGETVNFTFASSGGTGETGAASYSLVDSAGNTAQVEGVTIGNAAAIFTPMAAGTYDLIFMATDSLGIQAVEAKTVTITVTEVLAAKAVLSQNPISVDQNVMITLTATGGIGASTFSTVTEGVTLSSTTYDSTAEAYVATATFSSSTSGIFALKFTATDSATPERHTATANVSVIVDAPAPEPEPEDVVDEVVSDDIAETVIATSHELSSDLTTDVNDDVINNTMSKTASAAIASDDSYTSADKALAEGIDERNNAAVNDLKADGTFPPDAEDVQTDEITITPTDNSEADKKLVEENTNSGREGSARHQNFNVRNNTGKSGPGKISLGKFADALLGLLLNVLKIPVDIPNNQALPGFTAAAATSDDYVNTTVFLDSNGNRTTTIPTSVDMYGNPRIAGYVTMVTYLEAGKNYDMIISIPSTSLKKAGITTATSQVEVPLPSFTGSKTGYFSTFVSSDIITGTDYYRVGENVLTSKLNNVVVKKDWARTPEELQMAVDNNYTMITRLASLDATAEEVTHTYIVKAVFSADKAKLDRIDTTSEDGGFIFYPNGPANAAANAQVLKLVTSDDGSYVFSSLTPADIKDGVKEGYLAFSIAGGSTLTKPMLAVKLVAAETPVFSFALTTGGVTVRQGDTETMNSKPVNNSGDVTYTAYEGTTELDWFSYSNGADNDVLTFAPTASVTIGAHTVVITGVDEALNVYSTDITVTVLAGSGGSNTSGDVTSPLTLTSSKESLALTLGDTETLQLYSNAVGTAVYTVTAYDSTGAVADEAAGVYLDETTGKADITPTKAGNYALVFTVVDAGRTTNNTVSTTVPMVVTETTTRRVSGSSGGGCDAGFGALALAVLGGLIAARKK